MDHTQWVIQVLDDSNNKSIEYKNRVWLRKNVETMHIKVCVENCSIDLLSLGYTFFSSEVILVQDGKPITRGNVRAFQPAKEALLIYKANGEDNFVFLYSPKK